MGVQIHHVCNTKYNPEASRHIHKSRNIPFSVLGGKLEKDYVSVEYPRTLLLPCTVSKASNKMLKLYLAKGRK